MTFEGDVCMPSFGSRYSGVRNVFVSIGYRFRRGSNRLKGAYITYYLFFYIIRSGIECIEARK